MPLTLAQALDELKALSYVPIAALLFLVALCHGTGAGAGRDKIDDGHGLGTRNRLQGV